MFNLFFSIVLFFTTYWSLSRAATTNVNGPFKITVTNYGTVLGNAVPQELRTEIDNLFLGIQNEVNRNLPEADQSTYLKGMSDAGVIAVKGLGVDYASAPDIFVVGAGVGIGADIGNNSFSDLVGGNIDANQIRGFGAQGSLMAGLNLGVFDLPKLGFFELNRLTTFVNFFKYELPSGKDLSGKISNFGIHFQYQLYDGYKLPYYLFRWGGLSLTSGIDYSYMRLNFTKKFTEQRTTTYNGTAPFNNLTLNANFTGTAVAGAEVSVKTIPIEISTHVQLLYLLTLFGGLGMDINFGKATSLAGVNGNVTANDTGGNLTGVAANASLNLGDSGSPTSFAGRWFVGTQLNLSLLKVYAQLNSGIGQDTWGVNAGIRVAY